MSVDYVHKDTLTATDYVELNKNNELLISYNQALLTENKLLKNQLEEYDRKLFFTKNELDMRQKSIDNKLNQQKEFIEYLEKKINRLEKSNNEFDRYEKLSLKETLSKYKEIIGGKDDNK